MTLENPTEVWLDPVLDMLERFNWRGGFFVCFPQYRPDLVLRMAQTCQLELFDFRKEVMAPLGADAANVSPTEFESVVTAYAKRGDGLVVHNVEALLAVSSPQARTQWAKWFLDTDWAIPAIVPITLFSADLPANVERMTSLAAERLPAESLLMRLSGL